MPRIKIPTPRQYQFQCELTVMIGDINYGGHLGNDALLRLAHEARLRFLKSIGFSESDIGEGLGLIMSDAVISFKNQSFHGDVLSIKIAAAEPGTAGFNLYYLVLRSADNREIATIKTGMVCFDYAKQKISTIPASFTGKIKFTEI